MLPKFCVSTTCCGTGRCIFLAAANGKSDSPPAPRSRNIFSHPACRTFVTPEAECVSRGEVTKIFENARGGFPPVASVPSEHMRVARHSTFPFRSAFSDQKQAEWKPFFGSTFVQPSRACCRSFFSSGGSFFCLWASKVGKLCPLGSRSQFLCGGNGGLCNRFWVVWAPRVHG